MPDNSELRAARDEARRLQRNVNRKKLRLSKNKHVDFSHPSSAKYDPSVSPEKLQRLTLKQVQAANARMREFLSRKTQYYGDVRGRVLPPKLVAEYQKAEKAYITRATKEFMKIADVPAYREGSSKQTVFDVWRARTPTHGLSNAANTNPLTLKEKKLSGVTNEKSFQKLVNDIKKRDSDEWFKEQRKEHRKQADEMLRRGGLDDEADRIRKLGDDEFDLLWGDHRFAEAASLNYQRVKSMLAGTKKEWYDQIIDDAVNDISDIISWAEEAPKRRRPLRRGRRKK